MKQKEKSKYSLSEMVVPLLQWYDNHARILPWRENPEPYAVWISEIMLQQTRVEAVKPYFDRFMKAFPTLSSLADAEEETVLKLWEGLGYYSRVRNIHKAAKIVKENRGGQLPASFEALRSLPGIGEYTAGAISSIAFQIPVPCVDGNVLRVVTRITAESAEITSAATKRLLTGWVSEIIPNDRPGDFNQAMMELGATICLPNGLPKCETCPVAFLCTAYHQNRMTEFPVKNMKPPRKIEKKTILILLNIDRVALRKRPESGLLSGLWEFPNFSGELTEHEVHNILSKWNLYPHSILKLKKSKHIFSHIEWEMTGYLAVINNIERNKNNPFLVNETDDSYSALSNIQWIDSALLRDQLTLPTAFKPYYQAMLHAIE